MLGPSEMFSDGLLYAWGLFFQRIADFAQQQYFFAWFGRCFFGRCFLFFQSVQGFDHHEDGGGDDEEADDAVDEQAEVQGNRAARLCGSQ